MALLPPEYRARDARRFKVFVPGSMTVSGVAFRFHMLDVSSVGARLYTEVPPHVGVHIAIDTPLIVRATVIWVKEKQFGVRFHAVLRADVLAGIIG